MASRSVTPSRSALCIAGGIRLVNRCAQMLGVFDSPTNFFGSELKIRTLGTIEVSPIGGSEIQIRRRKMVIRMFKSVARRSQKVEPGMVSAEYAIGTVATTSIAGLLLWLAQQEWFRELIANLFRNALGI